LLIEVFILASEELWHSPDVSDYYLSLQSTPFAPDKTSREPNSYARPLMRLDSPSIHSAEHNIIEYVHPYVQIIAARFGSELRKLQKGVEDVHPEKGIAEDRAFTEKYRALFKSFTLLQPSLIRSHHHLSQFLEKCDNSPKMNAVLRDFETLVKQAKLLEDQISLFYQLEVFTRTLDEAIQTRQISVLAYLFVPLSLTASIFGMDLKLVSHSRWAVAATIIVLFGLAGLVWYIAGRSYLSTALTALRSWFQKFISRLRGGRNDGRKTVA